MSDALPFNAEAIAAALTHAATYQGDAASMTALTVSVPRLVITKQYMHGDTLLCFYLEAPARVFGQLFRLREEIQKNIFDMLQPIIGSYIPY